MRQGKRIFAPMRLSFMEAVTFRKILTRSGSRLAADLAVYLAVTGFLVFVVVTGARDSGYNWQWHRMPSKFVSFSETGLKAGPLLFGLGTTILVTACSFFFAFMAGLVAALAALSNSFSGRFFSRFYVETIRNTPLLIQIYFLYFVVGRVFPMDRFTCAVLALSLFEGAYVCEIIRAGILSVDDGQWQAAKSLGLSRAGVYAHVVLPQALSHVLAPLTSQAVSLVKDSALVCTIALFDLAMAARSVVSESFLAFETWLCVAAVYLVLTLSLSAAADVLHRKNQLKY